MPVERVFGKFIKHPPSVAVPVVVIEPTVVVPLVGNVSCESVPLQVSLPGIFSAIGVVALVPVCKIAPVELLTVHQPVPRALVFPTVRAPALIVVVPVYALEPVSDITPVPDLMSENVPLMLPAKVSVFPSDPVVKECDPLSTNVEFVPPFNEPTFQNELDEIVLLDIRLSDMPPAYILPPRLPYVIPLAICKVPLNPANCPSVWKVAWIQLLVMFRTPVPVTIAFKYVTASRLTLPETRSRKLFGG